jgi:hypothetical protein
MYSTYSVTLGALGVLVLAMERQRVPLGAVGEL